MKSPDEIPDFKSDDEIASWYQTHSTVLVGNRMEVLAAKVGGALRSRVAARRRKRAKQPGQRRARPVGRR